MSSPQKFVDAVAQEFGDQAANTLGSREPIRSVSSGSIGIDYIIGPYCPGWPLGKLSQIYGEEQSGKSLLCCQALAEAQKQGVTTFLVDRELHYTPEWFERFGGDKDDVVDLHPDTVEQCFGMVEMVAEMLLDQGEDNPGGLFVIDSLQSLPTQTQFDDDSPTAEGLAAQARYLSSRLGRYIAKIAPAKLGLLVVGQLRESPNPYASDRQYTPGGNALKHYSVLRLKSKFSGIIKEKDPHTRIERRLGFKAKIQTVKNDVGGRAPYKGVEVSFYDGSGADDTASLFQVARELDILEGGTAGWYTIPDLDIKFRGRSEWSDVLVEHPEVRERIAERAFDPNVVLKGESSKVSSDDGDEDEQNPVTAEEDD